MNIVNAEFERFNAELEASINELEATATGGLTDIPTGTGTGTGTGDFYSTFQLTDCLFDRNEVIPHLEIITKIDSDGKLYPFIAYGNISSIVAPPKAAKSKLITNIAYSLCVENDNSIFHCNKVDGDVVIVDNENSKFDLQNNLSAEAKYLNCQPNEPSNLYVYHLRRYNVEERFFILNQIFEFHKDKLKVLILDGVTDFVDSVNDEATANTLISILMSKCDTIGCAILCNIHYNSGDLKQTKARGHIGSEVERKSYAVISVTSSPDNDIKTIKPKYMRGSGNFKQIQIQYNTDINLFEKVLNDGISEEKFWLACFDFIWKRNINPILMETLYKEYKDYCFKVNRKDIKQNTFEKKIDNYKTYYTLEKGGKTNRTSYYSKPKNFDNFFNE